MELLSEVPQGHRVTLLRELEGLTQSDLASALGVSQGFVSQVEKGLRPLPEDVAQRSSAIFSLPVEFFHVLPDPSEAGVSTFRKNSRATVRDEKRIRSLHVEAARLFRIASQRSGYHSLDIDTVVSEDEEETAANLRAMLGISQSEPIRNVTRSLERIGVGVISGLDPTGLSDDHTGISRPSKALDRPLVATLGDMPGAVARFTILHELAHWLYDRDRTVPIGGVRSPEERRAHRFAGAMLLPAVALRPRVDETLTLHAYLRIKADFGVSVGAIISRAYSLNLISEQRQRSLHIQLSSQGWRRAEPVEVALEEPRLLTQAVQRGISDDPNAVARQTGIKQSLVESWTGLRGPIQSDATVIPFRQRV